MAKNGTLWSIQSVLAALFLFAGATKLILPIEPMVAMSGLPAPFLRFVGVCEVLGAVGLILPWLLQIRPVLTPIAASGLIVIMAGAVIVTVIGGSVAGAVVPAIVGAALIAVARGRGSLLYT